MLSAALKVILHVAENDSKCRDVANLSKRETARIYGENGDFVIGFVQLFIFPVYFSCQVTPFMRICWKLSFNSYIVNSFIPRSDQYINSPYNFNTLSSRLATRIKKSIN